MSETPPDAPAPPPDEPEAPETAVLPAPRRRAHGWLWLLAAPFMTLASLLVLLAVLPYLARPSFLIHQLETRGSHALGVSVKLRELDYHPFTGLSLRGLHVGPPEGYSEPLLELEGLSLRYRLWPLLSGRFELVELVIDTPQVVLEEVEGRRNLDVLLARLGGDAPPPEPAPKPPRAGSLSPIDVVLERVELRNLGFQMTGGGRYLRLEGLGFWTQGGLLNDRLSLGLRLDLPARREPANLQVSLPVAPFDVDAGLGLSVSATVAGSARDGLSLGASGVSLRVVLDALTFKGSSAVPPVDARLALDLSLQPGEDRAALDRLELFLADARVLRARAELDGLYRAFEQALGPGSGPALALAVGVPAPKGGGEVKLTVSSLFVPLDRLLPYARFFAPKAEAAGELEVGPVEVVGTVAELMASAPRTLSVPIALREVSLAEPERKAALGRLDGRLRFFRDEAEDRPFRLTGTLDLARLAFEAHRLDALQLELGLRLDRLSYPDLGFFELALGAKGGGIQSPPARLARLQLDLGLVGPDLFLAERASPVPAQLSLAARLGDVEVATESMSLQLAELRDELQVEIDRLLTPARRPLHVRNQLQLTRLEIPAQSLSLASASLGLDSTLDDPRGRTALDLAAKLKLRASALSRPPLVSGDVELDLGAEVKAQPLAPGVARLPEAAKIESALRLPRLKLASPELGELETSAGVELAVRARPGAERVDGLRLRAKLDDLLELEATGSARRILGKSPNVELKLRMLPLSVQKLLAKVPPGLQHRVPVTEGAGTVDLALFFSGPIPEAAKLSEDLAALPFTLDANLGLGGVDLVAPAYGLHVRGLEGRLGAEARTGRLMLNSKLEVGELARSDPKAPLVVNELAALFSAGLAEGRWAVDLSLVAGAVELPGQASGPIRGAAVELSAHHPLFGGVELERLAVEAAELGVRVDARGRLERRLYGALRPALTLRSSVDFDRLRRVLPTLPPVSGRIGFDLDLESPTDEALSLGGRLELGGLGYHLEQSEPRPMTVSLVNADGRLPFSQKLRVAPPAPPAFDRALGVLGDDLELRLQELVGDLKERSQLVVECSNVLQFDPKVAGYEALRPFASKRGARLTIEKIGLNEQSIDNLSLDILYGGGVLRLDRFAFQLFEGDIFGSFALQLAGRDAFRVRLQSGITDLNLDVPFSRARGLPPISNPRAKEPYLMSGTMDLQLDSRSRALNGSVDLTKMGAELFVRIIDAMDPNGENEQLQNTRTQLSTWMGLLGRDIVGVSLEGMKVDIKHNLLSMSFDWYRPWFDVHATSAGGTPWLPRLWLPATQLLFGTTIVSSIPEIKRYSLSPYLGQIDVANQKLAEAMVLPMITEGCEDGAGDFAGRGP